MNRYGQPAATDSRTLARRRRAKRAFAANYIHELSDRHNRRARQREPIYAEVRRETAADG